MNPLISNAILTLRETGRVARAKTFFYEARRSCGPSTARLQGPGRGMRPIGSEDATAHE
jgi:hypothetical protein